MRSESSPPKTVFGHGARPALALHCTLAHAGAWRAVGAKLAEALSLTAVDLPGHGKSPVWSGAGDLHDACTTQAATVLSEPMDVIGHSFGATVALRLAIEHPEKVRSLTMIEPVLFAAARLDAPQDTEEHLAESQPYMDALASGKMDRAARLFNQLWGDGTGWDDISSSARAYMTDRMYLVPLQTAAIFEDSANLLSSGRIQRVTMPTLLVSGTNSPKIARIINAALARRLRNVRSTTINGAGHMAPVTHPQAVAHAISRLLEVT